MANQIMTQEFGETIAATLKRDVPILEYVNKELSSRLVSGSGDTVMVFVPNYGKTSKGASFNPASAGTNKQTLGSITDLNVQVDSVPVKVQITKVGASFDFLEKALKLFTLKSQVEDPRISNLARTINAEVFKCVQSAAHSSIVGSIGFAELAEAVAYVDESRVGESTAGMLSPLLNNAIAASGAAKFANQNLAGPSGTNLNLYKGVLGEWMDAMFFKSADAGSIRLGSTQANAFALSGNVANVADGATSLSLSAITFGGSTLTKIPAGTPFIIGSGTAGGAISSPFTVSNVYGENTNVMRTFVALPNPNTPDGSWPIVSSGSPATYSATIGVAPIFLNSVVNDVLTPSSAAVPNTFYTGASAQASLTFLCPLLAGAKYACGAVFASNAIAFASAAPRPLATADSTASTIDGELNIRTSLVTDGTEGADIWRTECITGQSPLYGAGAVAIYGQIV